AGDRLSLTSAPARTFAACSGFSPGSAPARSSAEMLSAPAAIITASTAAMDFRRVFMAFIAPSGRVRTEAGSSSADSCLIGCAPQQSHHRLDWAAVVQQGPRSPLVIGELLRPDRRLDLAEVGIQLPPRPVGREPGEAVRRVREAEEQGDRDRLP